MNDWRSRAWYQVGMLDKALTGAGVPAADAEIERRKSTWSAIDRFGWPQQREQQFAQIEQATRIQAELLRGMVEVPPMRDLLVSRSAPDLPGRPTAFPDARARALFQVHELQITVGKGDLEARRRGNMWLAIERFCWPSVKEQLFQQLEQATHAEVGLINYLCQSPQAREMILKPREAAEPEERPREPEKVTVQQAPAEAALDPLGDFGGGDPGADGPYDGPPADVLKKDAEESWKEYTATFAADKKRATEAAAKLKAILALLQKNPDGGAAALGEVEATIGLKVDQVLANELERRLG